MGASQAVPDCISDNGGLQMWGGIGGGSECFS